MGTMGSLGAISFEQLPGMGDGGQMNIQPAAQIPDELGQFVNPPGEISDTAADAVDSSGYGGDADGSMQSIPVRSRPFWAIL